MAASPKTSEPVATRMIAVPGATLRVEQRGEAAATLFVHGLAGDIHSWDLLWDALEPEKAMARYDLRGFGQSVAEDDAPFDHVEDLTALLDTLGVGSCNLIGVSMGAGIALRFALDHRERVNRLVLISPMIAGWEWSDAWMARWRPITRAARRGDMDTARRLWWTHPAFDSVRDIPAGRIARDEIMRFSGAYWLKGNERPVMPNVERLHELACPTLLLTGGLDAEDFRLMADLIEAAGQNVRRVDRRGLGHMLYLEDPSGCAALIAEHIGSAAEPV